MEYKDGRLDKHTMFIRLGKGLCWISELLNRQAEQYGRPCASTFPASNKNKQMWNAFTQLLRARQQWLRVICVCACLYAYEAEKVRCVLREHELANSPHASNHSYYRCVTMETIWRNTGSFVDGSRILRRIMKKYVDVMSCLGDRRSLKSFEPSGYVIQRVI